ncbi:P-loop containing nucleoside triphosphate hydrolase protein [Gongronella butleri]|nr:P-loop containing nucleoside triphosphate hydrolase protein [Gongronella butleri]
MFSAALAAFARQHGPDAAQIDAALDRAAAKFYLATPPPPDAPPAAPLDTPEVSENASMDELMQDIQTQPFYKDQLDAQECQITFPTQNPQYGELTTPLPGPVLEVMEEHGISRLFSHQAAAINAIRERKNVIVSTSTASGKSLIYQLPLLEALLEDATTRALFIFPTKALAQDQQRSMQLWLMSVPALSQLRVACYDGDTPNDLRAHIRANANIILTNPDMLHHSILPNAKACWHDYFVALRFIVIDEIHVYHDLFGAHVGMILRRLRRLCDQLFLNERYSIISCSATLNEPTAHMHRLTGCAMDSIVSVENDGAPQSAKKMILWNPPMLDQPLAVRRGAIAEASDLLVYLVSRGIRTIVFCKLRKTCELLMKQVRETLESAQQQHVLAKIMSYRGGYTPASRRLIEQQMFRGDLHAIIATNALELGIDIGSLDAVMMVGIPWSLAAFWQQSGRAGRRHRESLTLVVADQNPLGQFYASHPQQLFTRTIPPLMLEVDNRETLEGHLHCAAHEMAISLDRDQAYFDRHMVPLCQEKLMHVPESDIFRPHASRVYPQPPSSHVQIRGIMDNDAIAIVDVSDASHPRILEELEPSRAPFEVYQGAIFLHKGMTYVVEECNMDGRYAKVHMTKVDWTTRQRDFTNVNSVSTKVKRPLLSSEWVCYGDIERETVVFGYYKLDKRNRILDTQEIHMDPILRKGVGLWVDLPRACLHQFEIEEINAMAAIHGAAHLMIAQITRLLSHASAAADVRTECKSPFATRHRPNRIILYENYAGLLRAVYDGFERLLVLCRDCIDQCPCVDGCPQCILLNTCSEDNLLCSKRGAAIIIRALAPQNLLK